ncbi:hypothetical protein NDU88_001508 [Pleurodeles waltl]|uniref:Synaptonemal complex protein 2 armadillo-repeat-like domain-containing protein n=1 Tax=Pleurodeles waltl TaxID=8319 RepID=A0AAV7PCQ8_PLEWA|nr:hypothetical protein NDU88_001508 [Pleurodeles waltl]
MRYLSVAAKDNFSNMPVKQDLKLEQYVDDASRKSNFQPLEDLLQAKFCHSITQKCSKQFFTKLDKLICRVSQFTTYIWR